MNAAHELGEFATEMKWAQRLLELGFANVEAHATLAGLYMQTNEPVKAKFHVDVATALIRSILSSGDGKTKETAFEVIADREEYAVLTALGLPYNGPNVSASRFKDGTHSVNRWQISEASAGQSMTVFFNEDAFLAKSLAR